MDRVIALFVAPNLEVGGAERQWSVLLPMLAERGVHPVVLTLDGRGPFYDALRSAGVETHCAGWTSRRDIVRLPGFVRSAGIRPDVVVARGLSAHAAAHLLSRVLRRPYVATEHTFYELMPHDRVRGVLLRALCRRADKVVALTGRQVPGLVGQGYRPERVVTIPNGVGEAPEVTAARRDVVRAALPTDAVVVALVAALRPEKRVRDFVDVVTHARESGAAVHGVVAGGGPDLDVLREYAMGTGGHVTFLGQVDDVAAVWASADIACLTSESEVLSMSLLEAMAHGLPLVATDVGGNADLCVDGVNGHLAAVGDIGAMAAAVTKLVDSGPLRAMMGAASASARTERFSAEAMASAFADLLGETARHARA